MFNSRSNFSNKACFEARPESRLRVFQRAEVQGEVLIHDDTRLYIAPLNNISAGGVFVDHLVSIPQGSQVRVVVRSPRLDNSVQAIGTVIRIEKQNRRGMAIEFTSISSKARELIQNCVFEARMEAALKVV